MAAASKDYKYEVLKTTVPSEMKKRFEKKAADSGYKTTSDYLRRLVERDLDRDDFLENLEGLIKGVVKRDDFLSDLAGDVADHITIERKNQENRTR